MSNIEENGGKDVIMIGKTIRDNDNNSTALIIPKEFVKELNIENFSVSMYLLDDYDGNKYLIMSKYHKEIVID